MSRMEFDYVIVGAGSAGCVLANRLSARAERVLLLEAGGPDSSPFIHMPAGIARLVDDRRVDWRYQTEPEPALGGRRLYWPRGRVLGGSSSINAMCYTRGHPRDYDEWGDDRRAAVGATRTCCPSSARPRTRRAARASTTAAVARCRSRTCPIAIR